MAITPTSGNLIAVLMFVNSTTTVISQPTGMAGASWTTAYTHATNATVAQTAACFLAVATVSSAITISVAWTVGGNADMVVAEFSNAAGVTTTLDGALQTQDTTTGASPIVLPTYTPGVTGDLAIHQVLVQNAITAVAGSYTLGDIVTNTSDAWGYTTGALSALTPSDSQTSGAYCSLACGIKVSTGAAAVPPDLIMAPSRR